MKNLSDEDRVWFTTRAEHVPIMAPDVFEEFKLATASVPDVMRLHDLWDDWGALVLCWVLHYFFKKDGTEPESVTMGHLRRRWNDIFGAESDDVQAADVLLDSALIK